MRLDKLLADKGFGTRSEVKEFIRKGRVSVNGKTEKDAGVSVKDSDEVSVDGKKAFGLNEVSGPVWFMLNKPAGVVSATKDNNDRTVIELLEKEKIKDLYPVGRLDKDTEGMLLVTNDGELGHYLLSPKRHVSKKYYAKVNGILTESDAEAFRKGIEFKDFTSMPAELMVLSADETGNTCEAVIEVCEGKFHEVKRLVASAGCEVTYLKRIEFGPLKLDDTLAKGQYRRLDENEIELLKKAVGK